jgi:hypothetical protein
MVAVSAWLTKERSTEWDRPLRVAIYPINADGSKTTQAYIEMLGIDSFADIEAFFDMEAERYTLALKNPVDVYLSSQIMKIPPQPPHNGSVLSIMYWSLKLRYWSWSQDNYKYPKDIQIFVLYYDPETHERVAHSLGLQKGLVGIVNAFSSERMTTENNIIIAHELLHTVGATDKYYVDTNFPVYPIGYAEPERTPLYPQKKAEIMAGRTPINENQAEIPEKLKETVIGNLTAREISWLN